MRRAAEGLTCQSESFSNPKYGAVFGPEEIASVTAAFEAALSKLGLVDRQDPLTMTVAKLVMQLAQDGESDPKQLCDEALKVLGK